MLSLHTHTQFKAGVDGIEGWLDKLEMIKNAELTGKRINFLTISKNRKNQHDGMAGLKGRER